jgi:ribosomal protein S18 acetylase RimI-like enzyme
MRYSIPWVIGAFRHHLWEKWRFVGFALPPTAPVFSLPGTRPEHIWQAGEVDRGRIERELFPELVGEQEYDRKYFQDHLGQSRVRCFLAERDDRLVHYTWVFLDAMDSPVMRLPRIRRKIRANDCYVGPAWTHPKVRGSWLYPAVMRQVIQDVRAIDPARRIVLVVAGSNNPAINFFTRLGFVRLSGL